MASSEPLGTGTLLLVDGRRADGERLHDPDALQAVLNDLAQDLEADVDPTGARVVDDDGTSHVLVLDEAYLVLHAFPELGSFSFEAFSRHALPDVELYGRVLRTLRTGRFESAMRRRATGMPNDRAALARRLAGERAWARARLADVAGAPLD